MNESFYTKFKPTANNAKEIDVSLAEVFNFPETIYVGELIPLSGLSVPALLPIKEVNGICFLSTPENVSVVHNCMQTIALRMLLSLPPGLCKMTLYDATGLGANLIGLSNLSPKIKGENILTEPDELKRALITIKNDIPNVIQKVLGHRYLGKTLIDYNAEAGELARPYHLLIIADFPHSLSKDICELVERIVQIGKQAGVFVILNVDGNYLPSKTTDYDVYPLLEKMTTIYQSSTTKDWYVHNMPHEEWFNKNFYFHLTEKFPETTLDDILDNINRNLTQYKKTEVSILDKLTPANMWKLDASSGVEIPIGKINSVDVQNFVLSISDGMSSAPHHCLIGGATGSGKTVLLHNIICNGAWLYSPETLQFILLDYKEGTEFKIYENLPHVKVLSMRSEREYGISVLHYLNHEIEHRGDLFREQNVSNIVKYNEKAKQRIPRILVVIDEFQKLLEGSTSSQVATILDDIGRRGRSFGINLILSTQSLSGVNITQTLSHLGLRITFKLNSARDCDALLGLGNHIPFTTITKVGEAVYNARSGLSEGNQRFQGAYISDSKLIYLIHTIKDEVLKQYGTDRPTKRFIYDGEVAASISDNPALSAGPLPVNDRYCDVYIGEPVALMETHTSFRLRRQNGSNVLIVGGDTSASISILFHSVQQVMSQSDDKSHCYLCDKIDVDSEWYGKLQQLTSMPQISYCEDDNSVEEVIHQLKERLDLRKKGEEERNRILLVINDAYNVRSMRKTGYKAPLATEELQALLSDGPTFGIHVILSFKTYSNFSAFLDPLRSLQEFDIRIELLGGEGYKIFGVNNIEVSKTGLSRHNIACIQSSLVKQQIQKFKVYTL